MGAWWSMPSCSSWNDADSEKIVSPCWTAITRRVENERPSRTRSTRYTIGTLGSPARTKYECSEWTRRSGSTVRPAATSAWPATCPPKTRCHRERVLTPRKMSRSTSSRSSSATNPSTASCPASASSVSAMPQDVTDVVHPDRVRRPGRRRRCAGHDDHEIVRTADTAADERRVDLPHHLVGGLHRPHEMGLGAPQQRHLTLHRLERSEHEQPRLRLQPREPAGRVAGLGERDQGDRTQRVGDV